MAAYEHTKKGVVEHAMECTKLANHRFGLETALAMALQGPLGIGGARAEKMIDLAKHRRLEEFNKMLTESAVL